MLFVDVYLDLTSVRACYSMVCIIVLYGYGFNHRQQVLTVTKKVLPCCQNCDLTLNFSCFTKRVRSCSRIMFYKMLFDR